MTAEQVAALGPAFSLFCRLFSRCFARRETRGRFLTCCRGLMSDLPRKRVEPIAPVGGTAVRSLQAFVAHHAWDHVRMRDPLQCRIAGSR